MGTLRVLVRFFVITSFMLLGCRCVVGCCFGMVFRRFFVRFVCHRCVLFGGV
ncbi:MAG TPA: hypothetical protein VGN16_07055 [Acidobacteriaceae bacterium]|jgi:hypothetical protein